VFSKPHSISGPLERTTTNAVTETLETSLADELIGKLVEGQLKGENAQQHILLLVNLGSLYPFTRASELLDEMDRRNVNTTIGIPFPGSIRGGKLSFFNEDARHYYRPTELTRKLLRCISMTDTTLELLFARSPTRELEEVQKVNEVGQAERDIDEFYETDSARKVLTELGEVVNSTGSQPRFRYVHATFGSGKRTF